MKTYSWALSIKQLFYIIQPKHSQFHRNTDHSMLNVKCVFSHMNKGPLRQTVTRIQALLPCRMRLTKQPFKQDCRSPVMQSSHLDVDLIQCTSALTKKARAVQWTKQTPKPFAILRWIAITISVMSHWLTHLFFCRAKDMENSLISMSKRWRNICWWWKRS